MRDYEEMTGEKYLQVLLRISCIVCNYICERGSYTCIQCLTLRICNFAHRYTNYVHGIGNVRGVLYI